jgi:hypothetical protein
MIETPAGWTFADANAMDWQEMAPGVDMKMMGGADGRVIALFKLAAGYVGGTHEHSDAEFSYVLDGEVVSNGVTMTAGHAYAAQTGTTHDEFRTESGATIVSVFAPPS